MGAITSPFAKLRASLPQLAPEPPSINATGLDNGPLPAFPSTPQPKVSLAPFNVKTATPEELAEYPLASKLRTDISQDLRPWGFKGDPEAGLAPNHPGFLGKLGHALSVITGGPNRREFQEMGLQKSLQDLLNKQAQEGLETAQTGAVPSETALREAQTEEAQARANPLEHPVEKPGKPITLPTDKGYIQLHPDGTWGPLEVNGEQAQLPVKASAQNAFAQWSANPGKYEQFQKTMDEIKAEVAAEHPQQAKNSSFMNIYAAQRFLQMAYSHNPELLPVASQMIGKLLNLTPQETSVMAQIPVDQPLSPVTGEAIGTSMPSAPTGATRGQAQTAQRVLDEMPRVTQEVNQAANDLGPVHGRMLVRYLLGLAGSTGDPATDRQLSTLRTDLMFMGSGSAKFHINSVRQAEAYEKMLDAGKSPAQALQGTLDSIKSWATTAAKQERGYGEQGARENDAGEAKPFSLKRAMSLPFNKGKTEEQVREDLKKHGYTVTE